MLAENRFFESHAVRVVLFGLILVAVGLTAYRTWRNWSEPSTVFNWEQRGHSDFHYGTYLPTKAFVNGDSPYTMDVCEKYQMPRPVPAFSPATFVFHWPMAFLELTPANITYFIYNVGLMIGLGFLCLRMVDDQRRWGVLLSVLLLIFLSRPGHQTLFTGYFTAELAIGTLLALHFARSNPWLAAFGLLLTSFKPNFCVPLIILMSCRRDFRAVTYGIFLCAVGAIAGIVWLSTFSSPMEVIQGILAGQEAHEANPTVDPTNTWVRTDLIGMISKPLGTTPNLAIYLASMIPLVAIPGLFLWNYGKRNYRFGASDVSGLLIGLTMLIAFYHSTYDALFLVAPWVALIFYGPKVLPELTSKQRLAIAALISVPAANYLATLSGRKLLGLAEDSTAWQWLTVTSGLSLLIALVLLVWFLFKSENQNQHET